MRYLFAILCVLLLCGCTGKETQYTSPHAQEIRESFSAIREDRQDLAQTQPPEEAPVVTPMVPFPQ